MSELRQLQEAFRFEALKRMPRCAMCPVTWPGFLQVHHCISQQRLRRELGQELTPEILWDPRNALVLCQYHHRQHEARMQVVPLESVSHEAWAFASELGLEWALEAAHPAVEL